MSWKLPNELHGTNVQKTEKANLKEARHYNNNKKKKQGWGEGRKTEGQKNIFKREKKKKIGIGKGNKTISSIYKISYQ